LLSFFRYTYIIHTSYTYMHWNWYSRFLAGDGSTVKKQIRWIEIDLWLSWDRPWFQMDSKDGHKNVHDLQKSWKSYKIHLYIYEIFFSLWLEVQEIRSDFICILLYLENQEARWRKTTRYRQKFYGPFSVHKIVWFWNYKS
jgi:hypothetical protein